MILARALLFRTPLILLDEPTVGLDPLSARAILDLIRGPLRERGQTIVLTDHQSAEMEAVADRIAVLRAGEIAMQGTPTALRARLGHLQMIEIHTEEMDLPARASPAAGRRGGAHGAARRVGAARVAHSCPAHAEGAGDGARLAHSAPGAHRLPRRVCPDFT